MKKIAFLALALLAACGGGGGDLTNSERATQLINAADETFTNFIEPSDGDVSLLLADITLDAPVQYSGAMVVSAGEGVDGVDEVLLAYLGELKINADFDVGTISGEATNFIDIENPDAFQGVLEADPVAGGDVTGTLTIDFVPADENIAYYNVFVSGDLEAETSDIVFDNTPGNGGFYGPNAEAFGISGGNEEATFNGFPGYIAYDGVAAR